MTAAADFSPEAVQAREGTCAESVRLKSLNHRAGGLRPQKRTAYGAARSRFEYSCEYAKHSLFLDYYLLIIVSFSI